MNQRPPHLRRCTTRVEPPQAQAPAAAPFRAKVGLQIESAGSAAILGKLKVKATIYSHGNPPTARPQGDNRESPLAPKSSLSRRIAGRDQARGFARHPGAITMLRGSSHGEEVIKKPHVYRISSKLPSQLRIRRTSPHTAADQPRSSVLNLQRRAECSRCTRTRYALNASRSKLAARVTRPHLTQSPVTGALWLPHRSHHRRPSSLCRGQSPPRAGKRKVRRLFTALTH